MVHFHVFITSHASKKKKPTGRRRASMKSESTLSPHVCGKMGWTRPSGTLLLVLVQSGPFNHSRFSLLGIELTEKTLTPYSVKSWNFPCAPDSDHRNPISFAGNLVPPSQSGHTVTCRLFAARRFLFPKLVS